MIRFVMENNRAILFNDISSEAGWVIMFDAIQKKFLVWDNAERHTKKEKCAIELDTLESVLLAVNSYT